MVRIDLPGPIPHSPRARMRRSTVQRATGAALCWALEQSPGLARSEDRVEHLLSQGQDPLSPLSRTEGALALMA